MILRQRIFDATAEPGYVWHCHISSTKRTT